MEMWTLIIKTSFFDVLVTPILIFSQLPNFNQTPASKSQPKFSLNSWPKLRGLKQWQRQECIIGPIFGLVVFEATCIFAWMTTWHNTRIKYQLVSVLCRCRRCFCRISILCLCTLPNVKSVAFPTTHYSITILATTFDFAFPPFKAALKIQSATFANM